MDQNYTVLEQDTNEIKRVNFGHSIDCGFDSSKLSLFSFPITLTYLFLYLISRNTTSIGIIFSTVISFIAVKNIMYQHFLLL